MTSPECPFCGEQPGAVWIILGPGHALLVCAACADRLVHGRYCFIAAARLRGGLPGDTYRRREHAEHDQ